MRLVLARNAMMYRGLTLLLAAVVITGMASVADSSSAALYMGQTPSVNWAVLIMSNIYNVLIISNFNLFFV
jgi:hypothetical protein